MLNGLFIALHDDLAKIIIYIICVYYTYIIVAIQTCIYIYFRIQVGSGELQTELYYYHAAKIITMH